MTDPNVNALGNSLNVPAVRVLSDVGVVPFLVVLFVCYMYVERLLPEPYTVL